MDDDNPFTPNPTDPFQGYIECEGDWNPDIPPSQAYSVWKVVKKHFPHIRPDTEFRNGWTAAGHVEDSDFDICLACAANAITRIDGKGSQHQVSRVFETKQSVTGVLRRKIDAIEKSNLRKWHEALGETTDQVLKIVSAAEDDLHVMGWTLGEISREVIGPTEDSLKQHKEFWEKKLAVYERALQLAGVGGRKRSTKRDEVVLYAVELWETLSGKTAMQPGQDRKNGVRQNEMTRFVADVIEVYREFGMKGAVSVNSGAFWERVLKRQDAQE